MVSNDMSDDDSVLDPEETRAESDDDDDNDAAFEKENGYDEGYGSDAHEHEDDLEVPEGDDDEEDDGPGVPASWVREREEERKEAAAKKAEKKEAAAPPPKKDKEKGGGPTLLSHFTKQNGGGKDASRAAAPAVKAVQPKAPLGASRAKGGKAATSAAAKETPRKAAAAAAASAAPAPKQKASAAQPFSFNNESEDDEAPLASTMAKNAGYGASIATVDAVQEYEDRMTAEAARAPEAESEPAQGAEPPCVHEAAKKRRYVMKNEKTKKWCEYKVAGLLFAQEGAELFELTMEQLTISSVKERIAMQTKLADEEMSKMLATLVIGEMKVDGSGSGSGPGITNLMGAIVNELPLSDTEREDVRSKMKDCDSEVELVQLVALDHSVMKRLFKVSNHSALPAIYNPNNNSSNKYRVPSKLEEQKEFDDNFEFIGTIETVKKARSSGKRSSDEANGGGASGSGSGSKADGKRPATAAAMGSAAEGDEEGPMNEAGWYKMKSVGDKEFNACYTELRCGTEEQFTLVSSGPGRFLLLKTPLTRA